MDNQKMGLFISELRKSLLLTQKELAAKLNVTDKAVSKWERGISCPDISLLTQLSTLLGITTTELLNGERAGTEAVNVEAVVANALEYGEKAVKSKLKLNLSVISSAYSIFILIGFFVVSVVDVAISRAFTWSLIPIIAGLFAWVAFFPAIRFGVKGILYSLISISIFIIPFLYGLDYAIGRVLETDVTLFNMGISIAPLSIAFMWVAYILFKKLKTRILLSIAILVLLSSPVSYFTNAMVSSMLNKPYDGVALILNTFTPVIVAAILFIIELVLRKKA